MDAHRAPKSWTPCGLAAAALLGLSYALAAGVPPLSGILNGVFALAGFVVLLEGMRKFEVRRSWVVAWFLVAPCTMYVSVRWVMVDAETMAGVKEAVPGLAGSWGVLTLMGSALLAAAWLMLARG